MDKDELNKEFKNYSNEDGCMINKIENNNFKINRLQDNNCINCQALNDSENNYCKECGASLDILYSDDKKYNNVKITESIKDILRICNLRNILYTSLLAILIIMGLSVILDVFISFGYPEIGHFINPIHITMAFNLGSLQVYSSTIIGTGKITANLGMISLLIVPIVSLLISSYIFMNKEGENTKLKLINSIGVGLSYSIILFIINILGHIRLNPVDIMEYRFAINFMYNPISILINGFILGFVCNYIVVFYKKHEEINMYIDIIKKAMSAVVIGYIVIFIILNLLYRIDIGFLSEIGLYGYNSKFSLSILASQIASYIWQFANFVPIIINNNIISLIDTNSLLFYTKLMFYSMVFLSMLIILITGYKLKYKYKENSKKPLLIFSISYSLLMGALSMFSNIKINGNISLLEMSNYQTSIFMGSNILVCVLISFVYSLMISYIGYKLNDFE